MTALSILRNTRGLSILGGSILNRQCPLMVTSLQKKNFMVSPLMRKRIYGPQEEHEKEREDHHWLKERYVAVALLPIIPTALAFPHPVLDTVLSTALVLHCHWRLSGVAEDYIHGELLPKIHQPFVLVMSILAFGSLCYFNYFDVGFGQAVQMLYTQL